MTAEDRVRWDAIYSERDIEHYPDPDPLLFEFTPPILDEDEHRALDLASGLGQNGLWLAEQGYIVDLMDISRVGLTRARTEMGVRNLRNVNLLQVDLDELELQSNSYELICVFRYLKRDLFPLLRTAIKPGGRIIYETFNVNYLKLVPDFNRAFLLEPGELAGYFGEWQTLFSAEMYHVSQLVAVKPSQAISG